MNISDFTEAVLGLKLQPHEREMLETVERAMSEGRSLAVHLPRSHGRRDVARVLAELEEKR